MSVPVSSAAVPASAPPAIDQAREPAWVRQGSPATQKAYQSALAFEATLVEQLAKTLTASAGLGGESSEGASSDGGEASSGGAGGGSAANPELSAMLPQALAAGIMNAGGLGMAAQMTRELEGVQAGASAHASGGTGSGGTGGAR